MCRVLSFQLPLGRTQAIHVYHKIGHTTATFDSEVPQYMRHNSRRPSQAAGNNQAIRTRNRVNESRVQDPNEPDMSGPYQAQRPGPSRAGLPAQVSVSGPIQTSASALIRQVVEDSTIASSLSSSVSFAPRLSIDGDPPRSGGGEGEKVNAADNTIHGASPAKSLG